jgi:hypothetical protein
MRGKVFFLILILLSFIQVPAQVDKSCFFGDISLGRKVFYYNTNNIQASFSIGISSNSTLGVFYSYMRYNSMPSNFSNGPIISKGFGILYNYYRYFKKSKKWGWNINGSFMVNRISIYDKQSGALVLNNRYSERELFLAPGIFFKPSKRVMLFTNIGGFSLLNNPYETARFRSSFAGHVNIGVRINIANLGGKKNTNK